MFVCQVGNVNLNTLTRLASEPKINNTFYIQDYNGLEGLLDNLQIKIYNIKGKCKRKENGLYNVLNKSS